MAPSPPSLFPLMSPQLSKSSDLQTLSFFFLSFFPPLTWAGQNSILPLSPILYPSFCSLVLQGLLCFVNCSHATLGHRPGMPGRPLLCRVTHHLVCPAGFAPTFLQFASGCIFSPLLTPQPCGSFMTPVPSSESFCNWPYGHLFTSLGYAGGGWVQGSESRAMVAWLPRAVPSTQLQCSIFASTACGLPKQRLPL